MKVLITGAFGGIGSKIALAFASRGDTLFLLDREIPYKETTLIGRDAMLAVGAGDFHSYAVDFRNPATLDELLTELSGNVTIDIVINCAGVQHIAALEELPLDIWNNVININLTASFLTIKHLLPGMCLQGFGRVINVASVHGLVASVHKAAYVSSKHGIIGLTKVAALETAAFGSSASGGVTVNAICPGWVDTPLLDDQIAELAARGDLDRRGALAKMLDHKQPSGRLTQSNDLVKLVEFLCLPSSHNLTGASIPIDGGWTAQ